jgi:alkylation response protein AidB-like acyl-CoA dehydrogenase
MVAQTVRDFVEREVIPVASEMEHRNEYPHGLVETMKTLGLFGLNVPDEYGGNEIDYTTYSDQARRHGDEDRGLPPVDLLCIGEKGPSRTM